MCRMLALLIVATAISSAASAQSIPVEFTLCAKSDTWMRPTPDVQFRIWNDNRYTSNGPTSYEWTHNFIWNAPDSSSITYHNAQVSGLWTETPRSQCPLRRGEPWTEIWALNHHVTQILFDGLSLTYSVMVEERDRGFEIIQFRRPPSLGAAQAWLRFVTADAHVLDEWSETDPGVFVPASRRR